MRTILSALTAAVFLGAATMAFAADATTTGTIKAIDMSKHAVTLDNGATYDVASGVNLTGMKVGEKVTLTYTQSGAKMDASSIKPAS
jgi:Cu/Ag efflux protein CusF